MDKISTSDVKHWIWERSYESNNMRNDGWTSMSYKRQLWEIKCILDTVYPTLPTFVGEEEWDKERVVELLKRK